MQQDGRCIYISSSSDESEDGFWRKINKKTIAAGTVSIVTSNKQKRQRCVVRPLPRNSPSPKQEQQKKLDDIEKIVSTLSRKLQSKKQFQRVRKKPRSDHKCAPNLSPVLATPDNYISHTRDDNKCRKMGLRKTIKAVSPFQINPNSSPLTDRVSGRKSSDKKEDEDIGNEAIQYLLRKRKQITDVSVSGALSTSEVADNVDSDTTDTDIDSKLTQHKLVEDPPVKINSTSKNKVFNKVRNGQLKLGDVCLACGATDNIKASHPLFEGGLCKEHHSMFKEWYFNYDQDGCQSYCAICCMGVEVIICDKVECGRCYCSGCLEVMVSAHAYSTFVALPRWTCFFCSDDPLQSFGLLRRRSNWKECLHDLLSPGQDSLKYPPPVVPAPLGPEHRRPIRVLSLFDGIATGMVALKQLGLQIDKFVASEIDEDAIRLVQNRHPEVIHVGDVTRLSDDDVRRLGPFDLVMGGSPCNDLSGANPRRKGLLDAEGTGCLFFDFYRVLRVAQPCHCDVTRRPFFWLFENVMSMKLIERERISRFLQCDPMVVNARLVSAAARPRLFWGNVPGLRQLGLKARADDRLTVQSCLEPGRIAVVEKLNTITTKPSCLYAGNKPPVMHHGKEDTLWSTEVERIFGVPEHYTDVNNLGPRERLALLGRSWSVPVIRHILSPLKEYFASTSK